MIARGAINATAAYDVLLTPALAQPPVPVGYFTAGGDPAEDFARQKAFTPFTAIFNLTGQPAISLPLHWNDSGRGPSRDWRSHPCIWGPIRNTRTGAGSSHRAIAAHR